MTTQGGFRDDVNFVIESVEETRGFLGAVEEVADQESKFLQLANGALERARYYLGQAAIFHGEAVMPTLDNQVGFARDAEAVFAATFASTRDSENLAQAQAHILEVRGQCEAIQHNEAAAPATFTVLGRLVGAVQEKLNERRDSADVIPGEAAVLGGRLAAAKQHLEEYRDQELGAT